MSNTIFYKGYSTNPNGGKRKKNILMIILIVLILVLLGLLILGCVVGNSREKVTSAIEENAQLKKQISEQQNTINEMQIEIDTLTNELAARPTEAPPVPSVPAVSIAPTPGGEDPRPQEGEQPEA